MLFLHANFGEITGHVVIMHYNVLDLKAVAREGLVTSIHHRSMIDLSSVFKIALCHRHNVDKSSKCNAIANSEQLKTWILFLILFLMTTLHFNHR